MDFETAREMLRVVRIESQRRADRLQNESAEFADDQWLFRDEPFANEMCLMLLTALHHQVEKKLLLLVACANVGSTITGEQYRENVLSWRKQARGQPGREKVESILSLKSFPEWGTSMESLRLLANCFKHGPTEEPDGKLLQHLTLPTKPTEKHVVSYAPLPESSLFRRGLAASVNLPKDADYCTIAERFVDLADQFLEGVRRRTSLAQITGAVSLIEFSG